jgi:hypothetical protein
MRLLAVFALLPFMGGLAVEKPKLVLDAPRVQSILPGLAAKGYGKRVEVVARLEGEIGDPEEFYCLDELWEWGDGTESLHENDCDPYEDGAEVAREFRDAHYFRRGYYEITLWLSRGDDTVIKATIDVQIR